MDDFTTAFLFIDNANQLLDYHQRSTQSFLLLAAIGIVLLICIGIFSAIRTKSQASNLIVVGIVLTGIGLGSARSHFEDYKEVAQDYGRLLEIYGNHQYKTAEGVIHVLHTQPYGGHDRGDIIEVGDTTFEISYFVVTLGYKDTLAHDGILTAGKYVRIYYYKEKTEHYTNVTILRVDIKNAETALRKNQNILISSSKF